jgi:uncharacterized membrane protein
MPRPIPVRHHRALIYASGAVELVCAVGLARRPRWASGASTAVLFAVFPANVQMAVDAGSGRQSGAMGEAALAWGRLPLQALMIWAARQARPGATTDPPGGRRDNQLWAKEMGEVLANRSPLGIMTTCLCPSWTWPHA